MGLDFLLIGVGALPLQCGELLLRRGHRIVALVSQDPRLERWAEKQGIPCHPPGGEWRTVVAAPPCDVLLSVVNPWVLPASVLGLPRRLAINYHDSLLPAHAGTHAPAWALWAGDPEHGITWHGMEERVDGGDILKQERFAVAPDDTAFTLNLRCYETALRTFGELLEEIEQDRVGRRPQADRGRSFHRRTQRPPDGGVLSWSRPAEELARQVRALDFGTTPNPLLCAKLAIGGRFAIVRRLDLVGTPSTSPPGTVTGLAGTALQVATASCDVALREVATIDGRPLGTADLLQEFRLHRGYRFPALDEETGCRLTRLGAELAPHEPAWAGRLARLAPVQLPSRSGAAGTSPACEALPMQLPAPAALETFLGAFALVLAQLAGASAFDVGYRSVTLADEIRGLEGFFAASVPLRVDLSAVRTLAGAAAHLRDGLSWTERHRTYARDLVARFPQLQAIPSLRREPKLDVRVEVAGADPAIPRITEGGLVVLIDAIPPALGDAAAQRVAGCRWLYSRAAFDEQQVKLWQGELGEILASLLEDPGRPVPLTPTAA